MVMLLYMTDESGCSVKMHEERSMAIIYLQCSVSDENFCSSYLSDSDSTSNWILNEFNDPSLAPRQLTPATRSDKVQSGTMSICLGTNETGEKAICMQLPCPSHRGRCWVSPSGLKLLPGKSLCHCSTVLWGQSCLSRNLLSNEMKS